MGDFLGIEVQLSAIIEAMNEDWHASLTSNFSLTGLNQLIYLMTIVALPNTRIADLRVDWKYTSLLKRLSTAFERVKSEGNHWRIVQERLGQNRALITEDAVHQCAVELGWKELWMSQSQNSSQGRSWVPATEHGSLRAFVRPFGEASVPPFREVPLPDPPSPVRVRSNAPRTNVDAIATPVRNMHQPGAPQAAIVQAPRLGSPAASAAPVAPADTFAEELNAELEMEAPNPPGGTGAVPEYGAVPGGGAVPNSPEDAVSADHGAVPHHPEGAVPMN